MHIHSLATTNTILLLLLPYHIVTSFSLTHNKSFISSKFHKHLCLKMSSSAYILLLLFLFFSLHACNARRHPSSLDKKMEKKPHLSLKIVEKNGFDSSPKKVNEGDNKIQSQMVDNSEKPKNRRSTNHRILKGVGKISIGLQTKSQVSVSSWHVPHKKHSEKHPGFNLDYSPPKTHPPSHN